VWKITGLNIHGFSGKTIAASIFLWENRVGVSEFDLRKKNGRVSKVIQHDLRYLSSTHED